MILTVTNVFEEGHPARTDARIRVLTDAKWFYVPYPGQFGWPTVTIAGEATTRHSFCLITHNICSWVKVNSTISSTGVLGMLAGVLACTVESISYYPTVAQMCAAPPPPLHAINRGIGTEGLGTVLAGLWGSGNGTNTFGENVGAIGVTKVSSHKNFKFVTYNRLASTNLQIGSRRVIQWAAFIMVLQGVIGKFGALFIMIPDPVVGGIFCVMFGMITAFGKGFFKLFFSSVS